ncbi:FAD-dependent oxidoreductase [Roseibium sp.]|uniref:flavin monoamine oxidase family protein n=1 Tax=Roseibium sp. TaxID=1936156 RepID=UPI003BA895A1
MKRRTLLKTAISAMAAGFVPLSVLAEGKRAPTGYLRTNWSRDPYSFGSYSYVAKGARRRDHAALGEPVGDRLFFAGEAAHPDYNSTVHAAYESGLMAAEAVFGNTEAEAVAVVGAGASGLAAANRLTEEGYEVTVLEARHRTGGRIVTDRSLGMPLDLGASWIHGTDGNPLTDLAGTKGLVRRATDETYVIRGGDGREISDADAPAWLENVLEVQHSLAADAEDVNGAAYRADADYDGEEVILTGGYDQLLDGLTAGLDIRFGHVVTHIDVDQDGVRLRDSEGREATFDAVILTVPLGVLKQGAITISPPVPRWKQEAIARLGMGTLDKVYLRYDDVFWDKDVTWIATPENGLPEGQFNQWLNLHFYTGEPVIVAFNGAGPARDLAALPDLEIVRRARQTLERAYP